MVLCYHRVTFCRTRGIGVELNSLERPRRRSLQKGRGRQELDGEEGETLSCPVGAGTRTGLRGRALREHAQEDGSGVGAGEGKGGCPGVGATDGEGDRERGSGRAGKVAGCDLDVCRLLWRPTT